METKDDAAPKHTEHADAPAAEHPGQVTRSAADDLSVWESARRHKHIGLVAMAAAFSASLDGYQINLNGGIVSNKGFIRQMASPGTTIIDGKYISAWGGIQSAGQTVGQVLLQFVTEWLGRKVALYIIIVIMALSVLTESLAHNWQHWLIAKLLSGMAVGMLQSTLPVYLAEISPVQLRGFFINSYSFWFVLGQLFASVALNELHMIDPLNFRTAIYSQWAMVGVAAIIFLLLPESPWWLASKNRLAESEKILTRYNGSVQDYNVQEQLGNMVATIKEEQRLAEQNSELGMRAVFQGRNSLRLLICAWPKITQQFLGLTVFNTFATYFFQYAGNKNPFLVTVILSCTQLLSMILVATLTDSLGRRPLTVYPYAVTAVSVLCLGVVGCVDYTKPGPSGALVFLACLATFSTTGASAIGYAYAAEIPQQRLRAQTAGFALAASNLVAILFNFCTPLMINGPSTKWGIKTAFFFAGTGAIAVVISWFILPEVARRTPAEIDELFEKKVNLRQFDKYITEVQMSTMRQRSGKEMA